MVLESIKFCMNQLTAISANAASSMLFRLPSQNNRRCNSMTWSGVSTMTGSSRSLRRATDETLALVLAGGRGERLQALTSSQAKPCLPFGGKFRLIDFPLSNCVNSGIRRVAVATQYCAHTLIHHVQRTWGSMRSELGEFVEVWPAEQQEHQSQWYAGTADAVFKNLARLRAHRPKYVLILAGDHIYKQDYAALLEDHIAHNADVTVACIDAPRSDAHRFGVVCADADGFVTKFVEKPRGTEIPYPGATCLVSMGIYIFNADCLYTALFNDAQCTDSSHDFGKNLLPDLVGRARVLAHRFRDSCVGEHEDTPYWRDVGTVEAFWQANIDLVGPDGAGIDLYNGRWPIWTAPDHAPPVQIVSHGIPGLVTNSVIASGCVIDGGTVRRSVLCTETHVGSFSRVSESVVLPGCRIGARAQISRAIIGEDCRVPAGLVIGENAEEDARRFERSSSGIVLVTQAMLDRLHIPLASPRRVSSPPSRMPRAANRPELQILQRLGLASAEPRISVAD
jgi:glucose-1-phosphate adenylyltransferase